MIQTELLNFKIKNLRVKLMLIKKNNNILCSFKIHIYVSVHVELKTYKYIIFKISITFLTPSHILFELIKSCNLNKGACIYI